VATIWTGKSADVATAHVACGALCLVTGGLTALISFRMLAAPVEQGEARIARNPLSAAWGAEITKTAGLVRQDSINHL
jgi:hypothetical protein